MDTDTRQHKLEQKRGKGHCIETFYQDYLALLTGC